MMSKSFLGASSRRFAKDLLLDDRSSELEERQKQVEELPIQRRRLAETIAELQNLRS